MDEAARALVTFLVVIGCVTVGVAIGIAWLYFRGELQVSMTRCGDDCYHPDGKHEQLP